MKPDLKGLTKLAEYLRGVPRKEFEMEQWYVDTGCGTKACIAGHAAVCFPSRFDLVDSYTSGGSTYYETIHKTSQLYGASGFAQAFKISQSDAEDLTVRDQGEKHTPKMAAKAVMKLVNRLKKESVKV